MTLPKLAFAAIAAVIAASPAAAEPQGPLSKGTSMVVDEAPPTHNKPNVTFLAPVNLSDPKIAMMYGHAIGCGDGFNMAARLLIVTARGENAEEQIRLTDRARLRAQNLLRQMLPQAIGSLPEAFGAAFNERLMALGREITKTSGVATEIMAVPQDMIPVRSCILMEVQTRPVTWEYLKSLDMRIPPVPRGPRMAPQPRPREFTT